MVTNKSNENLTITWQRLISQGNTCLRCGSTEVELDKAVLELKKKLNPMGIRVTIVKSELTLDEFKKNPIQSNRILINNVLLEDLIDAKTGQSQCCDVCGDQECRTVEVDGESHEVVTADMIIEAGLMAVKLKI
jgi:hypothetical protein